MTAIEEFNLELGYNALDPIARDDQPGIILLANAAGRLDLAQKLREHFTAQRVADSIRRETLTPVVGYGYNEETGEYEDNRFERRQSMRGARWWMRQGMVKTSNAEPSEAADGRRSD